MVRIKICGITNIEDALAAVEFGADALGFVFFRESPRYIEPAEAAAIIRKLPPFIQTVGVFVDEPPDVVAGISAETGISVPQLHGSEPPEACSRLQRAVKAIRVKSLESLEPLVRYQGAVSAFLLDTYSPDELGGSGRVFNWDIAVEAKRFGRIILAGGLTPDNVVSAIRHVRPYGVDVSSGIEESRGRKDLQKMRLFIERAKAGL
ncbi:MAG: phosphoribosylanthranilate isomerase [Thermodesulfovibrionales bacterium]